MNDIKLEIDNVNLLEFLQRIKSMEYLLVIDKDGLRVSTMNEEQTLYQNILLKKEAFLTYPSMSEGIEVPIENNMKFKDFVSRFKTKIQLVIGKNYLVMLGPDSEKHMILASRELITQTPVPSKIKYDVFARTKTKIFQEAIKDGTLMDSGKFSFEVKDSLFTITTTNEIDKCIQKVKIEYPDVRCKYGIYIQEIFGGLSGDVSFAFGNDKPLMVKHRSKFVKTTYILAPYIEPTEEKEIEDKGEEKENAVE